MLLHSFNVKNEEHLIDLYNNNAQFHYLCERHKDNTFMFINRYRYIKFANIYIDYATVQDKREYFLVIALQFALENDIYINQCIRNFWGDDIDDLIKENPTLIINYAKRYLNEMPNKSLFLNTHLQQIFTVCHEFINQVPLDESLQQFIKSQYLLNKLKKSI